MAPINLILAGKYVRSDGGLPGIGDTLLACPPAATRFRRGKIAKKRRSLSRQG